MIRLELPGLPPSSNNIYFNLPGGGRALKSNGKKYKNEAQTLLASRYPKELAKFVPNCPYVVLLRLHFLESELSNPRWGKTPKGTRYKKTDGTNRIKIIEDVLKDVTGVDDSCTMVFIVQKVPSKRERTELFVWNTDQEESPFDAPLFNL
jgi:hypothetical protein